MNDAGEERREQNEKNRELSLKAFLALLSGLGINYFANRYTDNFLIFLVLLVCGFFAVVVSVATGGLMKCLSCGKRLVVEPFPPWNLLPQYFLWLGLEARCASCHEKV